MTWLHCSLIKFSATRSIQFSFWVHNSVLKVCQPWMMTSTASLGLEQDSVYRLCGKVAGWGSEEEDLGRGWRSPQGLWLLTKRLLQAAVSCLRACPGPDEPWNPLRAWRERYHHHNYQQSPLPHSVWDEDEENTEGSILAELKTESWCGGSLGCKMAPPA